MYAAGHAFDRLNHASPFHGCAYFLLHDASKNFHPVNDRTSEDMIPGSGSPVCPEDHMPHKLSAEAPPLYRRASTVQGTRVFLIKRVGNCF